MKTLNDLEVKLAEIFKSKIRCFQDEKSFAIYTNDIEKIKYICKKINCTVVDINDFRIIAQFNK